MPKRQVEVFTAGCPVCDPVVQLVKEMACPDCEVIVHDLRRPRESAFTDRPGPTAGERAARYGVTTVPVVVVDGTVASCCQNRGPNREDLAAAGIGQRL